MFLGEQLVRNCLLLHNSDSLSMITSIPLFLPSARYGIVLIAVNLLHLSVILHPNLISYENRQKPLYVSDVHTKKDFQSS